MAAFAVLRFAGCKAAVRHCSLALALVLAGTVATTAAETYPNRPIRLVVGFLAGGPTDIPARFIADRLSAQFGQKVFVENKPGAGGMIALNEVLAQPRDGYTLQFCTYFDAINTLLYKNVSYKLADIAPVALVSKYYYLIGLAKSVPVENFDQFVSYAKAHPGDILYGTVGAGSTQELGAHHLGKAGGTHPFSGRPAARDRLVLSERRAQGTGLHQPRAFESLSRRTDLDRARLCAHPVRLARRLRRGGHAEADRRERLSNA